MTQNFVAVATFKDGLPVVIQGSVHPDTDEGNAAAYKLAWELFQRAKARVPFQVVEILMTWRIKPEPQPADYRCEYCQIHELSPCHHQDSDAAPGEV